MCGQQAAAAFSYHSAKVRRESRCRDLQAADKTLPALPLNDLVLAFKQPSRISYKHGFSGGKERRRRNV
ncbi:hypothetical protein, partial [Mesorhizobium sp. M2E.F.Ca.ET.209.01.1.1]|uniref:hypothetical protein n=1 Tax=Mesorhizobium sp. M2E.F.Ca.ET.209.01.1.1 TaxID=2500526 RepID=UPI001AED2BD2